MIILKPYEAVYDTIVAGAVANELLIKLGLKLKSGVTTASLDSYAEHFILKNKCIPSFKGYNGYPNTLCTSVNEVVLHGVPSDYELKDGDVISIDVGVNYNGWHVDTADTFMVGFVNGEKKHLINTTRSALYKAIKKCTPESTISDISKTIYETITENGFHVIKKFAGHGVGKMLHEDPIIPNYFDPCIRGVRLKHGMILAIEPITSISTDDYIDGKNGWDKLTADGSIGVQVEQTILITNNEPIILT